MALLTDFDLYIVHKPLLSGSLLHCIVTHLYQDASKNASSYKHFRADLQVYTAGAVFVSGKESKKCLFGLLLRFQTPLDCRFSVFKFVTSSSQR